MAGYFAVFTDFSAFLNFDKSTNLGVITDLTTIEIHEVVYRYVFAEFYVGSNLLHEVSWLKIYRL
jgi:hypothetical protein